MIALTILGQPASKKNSMRIARTARGTPFLLPSKASAAWTRDAVQQLRLQYWHDGGPLAPLEGPLSVQLRFYLRDGRSEPDLDNLVAAAFDVLQSAKVIGNDRRIVALTASKSFDKANPRVELVLHEVAAVAA